MEFSSLSLQERERLAYIAGDTKLARMLAEQIALQEELDEANNTMSSMQSELDQS